MTKSEKVDFVIKTLKEIYPEIPIPFEIFVQAFRMYFQINGGAVVEFLDKKFEVQKIEDQQGNLLYID